MAKKRVCTIRIPLPGGKFIEFENEQEAKAYLAAGGIEELAKAIGVELPIKKVSSRALERARVSATKKTQSALLQKAIVSEQLKTLKSAAKGVIANLEDKIKMLNNNLKSVLKTIEKEGSSSSKIKLQLRDVANKFVQDADLKRRVSPSVLKVISNKIAGIKTQENLDNFEAFINKVVSDSKFEAALENIEKNKKGARKRKVNRFTNQLREFASLPLFDADGNQTLTDEELEAYSEALKELNTATPNPMAMFKVLSNGKTLFDTVLEAKAVVEATNELAKLIKLDRDAASKFAEIMKDVDALFSVSALQSFDGYLKFRNKMTQAQKLLNDLYSNELISEAEYNKHSDDLFKMNKNQRQYEQRYENEIKALKDISIARIKDNLNNVDDSGMTTTEKEVLANLKRIVNNFPEYLKELQVEDLITLERVSDVALDGFLAESQANAILRKAEVKGQGAVNKLKGPIAKLKEKLFNKTNWAENLDNTLKLNEVQNYEGILGIVKDSSIFKFILNPTDVAISSMRRFQTKLMNAYMDKMPKIKKKDVLKNRYSAGMLAHFLEHGFNSSKASKPAIDYIGEQLNNEDVRSVYRDNGDLELVEEIYNSFLSNPSFLKDGVDPAKATFGDLDYSKIYEAFNSPNASSIFDANVLKTYQAARDTFNETAPYGVAANSLRNINGMVNDMYIPHSYLYDAGSGMSDAVPSSANNKLSTRAGSTYERISDIPLASKAINFNMDSLVMNHVSDVSKDYFLTKRLKELNEIARQFREDQDKPTGESKILGVIINNEKSRMFFELNKNSDALTKAMSKFSSATSSKLLIGPRIIAELLTNTVQLSIAAFKNPINLIRTGMGKDKSRAQKVMDKVGSSLLEKTRFRSAQNVHLEGGEILKTENNLRKLNEFVNGLTDGLFSSAIWFPSFMDEFEVITGEKWNDSFLNDDKYFYAIKEAGAMADKELQSVLRGALKAQSRQKVLAGIYIPGFNKFLGKPVDSDSASGIFLGFFNGYLFNDFQQGIIGAREIYNGEYNRGSRRVMRVASALVSYSLFAALVRSMTSALLGDDDEKEKAKEQLKALNSSEGAKDFAIKSVIDGIATFWSSSQNAIGRILLNFGLNYAYNSIEDPKLKKDVEDMMGRMYIRPIKSKKDVYEAFVGPQYKEISNMVFNELEAMAGKQNVSVTSLITRLGEQMNLNDGRDLTPEEYEMAQLLSSLVYMGNLVAMTQFGGYIPGTKEIKSYMDVQLEDATSIGGRAIWDSVNMTPVKEVSILDPQFTKERNAELSEQATTKMIELMNQRKPEIEDLIKSGKITDAKVKLKLMQDEAKIMTYLENGLQGGIPKSSALDQLFKKDIETNKSILLSDEEVNDALNNSDSRVQSLFRSVYAQQYAEDKAGSELLGRSFEEPKLEDFGLRAVMQDGKIIKYEEIK